MAADPLEEVLRLVAEGRLTADEAAPILAALEERAPAGGPARGRAGGDESSAAGSADFGAGFAAGFGSGPGGHAGTAEPKAEYGTGGSAAGGGSLRLEVREAGRQVVNLRLPVAVGRYALDRVPGLSGEQVDSVREALRTGMKGPVLEVDDGSNSVRIIVE